MPLVRKDAPAGAAHTGDTLHLLTGGSPDERRAAARQAAALPSGVDALGTALARETDPGVRETIFAALGRAGTDRCVDILAPYVRDNDPAVRTAALDALHSLPDVVAPRLPAMLADPDSDVRVLSCEIARALPAAAAEPLMVGLLDKETDPNVCAAAVDVLSEVGGPASIGALERCAARFDGEPFLGFAIKAVLERIGSPA